MDSEIETVREVAKATQAVAKAVDNGIDLTRNAGGFLREVFGPSIVDTVGIYGDFIGNYRATRAARLKDNTTRRHLETGVKHTRSVPPKIAVALLEQALLEDEEPLEILWANLLASAMDPGAADPQKKFVSVLEDLNAADAEVLRALRKEWEEVDPNELYKVGSVSYGPGVDGIGPHSEISVITLARLSLIGPSYTQFTPFEGDANLSSETIQAFGDLQVVRFTAFGIAFCEAVGLSPKAETVGD